MTMPLFFFHLRDAGIFVEDKEGSLLPDLAAARAEAQVSVRELVAQLVQAGRAVDGKRLEIATAEGAVLALVPLQNAIIGY